MLEDYEKIKSYGIENRSIIVYNGRFKDNSRNNNTTNFSQTPNEEKRSLYENDKIKGVKKEKRYQYKNN